MHRSAGAIPMANTKSTQIPYVATPKKMQLLMDVAVDVAIESLMGPPAVSALAPVNYKGSALWRNITCAY